MPQDTPRHSNNSFDSNIYPVRDAFYEPALRKGTDKTAKLTPIKRRKPHKVVFKHRILELVVSDLDFQARTTRNSNGSFQLRRTTAVLVLACLSIGLIFENLSHANRCKLGLSTCYLMRLLCEVPTAGLSINLSKICDIAGQTHYIGSPNSCVDFKYENKAKTPFKTAISSTSKVSSTVKPQENHASYRSGARILSAFTSPTYKLGPPGYFASAARFITGTQVHQMDIVRPIYILDETVVDGECWETVAGNSRVGILLSDDTSVSYVSLNYIPIQQLTAHAASRVPYEISIWGLVHSNVTPTGALTRGTDYFLQKGFRLPKTIVREEHFVQLGRIHYNASSSTSWQQFPISPPFSHICNIRIVVVDFEVNSGGNTTCIYTLGIHGPGSQP